MLRRRSLSLLLAVCAGSGFAALQACGSSDNGSSFPVDSGTGGGGGDGSAIYDSGGGLGGGDGSTGPHADFPATPILDAPDGGAGGAPANAQTLFSGATPTDGGANAPCLVQSEVGSLLPKNWLRPRFGWQAGGGENLFELRVHADNQVNDLVVYTTQTEWTMPQAMWTALAADSAGVPMTVSVRGAVFDGTNITSLAQGSSGPFGIAPVDAPGAIVYWQITGGNQGDLLGFNIGDETVQNTMLASTVKEYGTQCIGCHTSTPDGNYAVFSSNSATNTWDDGIGSVKADAGVGGLPPFLSTSGQAALQGSLQGIMATSIAHWSAGDYMVLAASNDNKSIQWAELDGVTAATATGTVPITSGDPNSNRTSPTWSHDGKSIAYTSAPGSSSGRPSGTGNDIYVMPYNDKAGGVAKPVTGANTAANEYYPSYSPDDKWITFNRTADGDTYSQPGAEVYVTKADGSGTATRLAANDPPACSNRVSPGITNSWPRWAPAKPAPQTVNGMTYYWVVFSSKRFDGTTPQLYMAPVVVDASGNVQQYKAVYLWNQPATEHNHTPAWDVFAIPPAPPTGPR